MRPEQRLRAETVERRLSGLRAETDGAPPLRLVDPVEDTSALPAVLPAVLPAAPPVPVPGRHASRRRWLPVTLQGRAGLEPWHVGAVAGVLLIALAVTCWWMLHRTPTVATSTSSTAPALASASPLVAGGVSAAGSAGSAGASTQPAGGASAATSVTVDVAGKVRKPGVRTLPAGSRVIDALQAAGGVRQGVDLTGLNQARVLVDGEQILVDEKATVVPPAGSGADNGAAAGGLVNLNTATAEQLDTLPGVGPVTAQSILDYRTQHGGFGSVQELLDVDGIGEATLAKLEPHVTV
ncbi:helix-hairpin-helix domain-containing protein [Nocardioides sp. Kera G14]|uniref:helix-hairpin-helix domain-containing protein n=1 Tax=Nocardioides sp. Kera G14 TaxID=2884264 RepID=UPI001D123206|nr:helix-hairpin-helix domain-containing protein [Nocardioides sp. Kera G14]UDY24809.1 helix-hairpin-helix domain-containing protein [Nocardioides sp. Kera G14]